MSINLSLANTFIDKGFEALINIKNQNVQLVYNDSNLIDASYMNSIDLILKNTLIKSDAYTLQNLLNIIESQHNLKFDSCIIFVSNNFFHDSRESPTIIVLSFYQDSVLINYSSAKDSQKFIRLPSYDISSRLLINQGVVANNELYLSGFSESLNITLFISKKRLILKGIFGIDSLDVINKKDKFAQNFLIVDYSVLQEMVSILRCK